MTMNVSHRKLTLFFLAFGFTAASCNEDAFYFEDYDSKADTMGCICAYFAVNEVGRDSRECWGTWNFQSPAGCDTEDPQCATCPATYHETGYCNDNWVLQEWGDWTAWTEETCVFGCTYRRSRHRCRAECCVGCTPIAEPNCRLTTSDQDVDDFEDCIEFCQSYECDGPLPSVCVQCVNSTTCDDPTCVKAYHLEDNQCEHRCNWLGHWCWPGTCDIDSGYLATTCSCTEGFELYAPDEETSKCKLTHPPDIHTCRLRVVSQYGELATTPFVNGSTACNTTIDGHVNFPPVGAYFQFDFQFLLPVNPPEENSYNSYAVEEGFGIIAASITVLKYSSSGEVEEIESHNMNQYNCNHDFNREEPAQGQIVSCADQHYYSERFEDLKDGEKICHTYRAIGSGFVYIKDTFWNLPPERFDEYGDTFYEEERCFITDFTSPDHCLNLNSNCGQDVLNFGHRIRKSLDMTVNFGGWFDPEPDSTIAEASGMKEYELELRDVIYTPTELYADWTSITSNITQDGVDISFTLPDRGQPHMFAIYVWAKDSTQESSNYRIARRFVLTDNTSAIETSSDNPIIVESANPDADYEWQVELIPVVVDWTNHFYNNWHVHTNLLLPIRSETNTSQPIEGIFEQETGELPVSGTDNIDGVTNFQYKYLKLSQAADEEIDFTDVPDPFSQRIVVDDTTVQDGDILEITIKAIDIMNNTKDDSVTLFVDSTPPIIEEMYLMKDGYRYLFVHNTTDLSQMDMTFISYDPHSGDQRVLWRLGHEPGLSDVGQGALPVVRLSENGTCTAGLPCYCPTIGLCEYYNYSVPLDGLIPNDTYEGTHNREYHFTFEAMNEAHLVTIEQVTILVDDSPPKTGHVFDGPTGSPDRDYQSEPIIDWHWVGFIDHESGITKYHFGIGSECFTKNELQFLENNETGTANASISKGETVDTFTSFEAEFPGFYRISVIAFNGAMEPSETVCSSGIILDVTPPVIKEMYLIGARFTESVICNIANDTIYALTKQGILEYLFPTESCIAQCSNDSLDVDIHRFPIATPQNSSLSFAESDKFCEQFIAYDSDSPVYLSNDNIDASWDFSEPESQMLDYYVGMSTTGQISGDPDITGFLSSHNHTWYKCYHCGLSQADAVYINIKAINKANLEDHFIFGQVIVDLTPPDCSCATNVIMNETVIIYQWPKACCYDTEDSRPLTDYVWSFGTDSNPAEVSGWTEYRVPHGMVAALSYFEVSVNKSLVQQHDQDVGNFYRFTLHAYNRVGLFGSLASESFQIHSKQLPSTGVVFHIDNIFSTNQIGFQENLDTLCASWFGFVHHRETLLFSIAVGTAAYRTDIRGFENTSRTDSHCVTGLNLVPFEKYYISVRSSNSQGYSTASTHGIFVGDEKDILRNASVDIGAGCPLQFENVLYSTILDDANDSVVFYSFSLKPMFNTSLPITSFPERTVRIILSNTDFDDAADLIVFINDVKATFSTWNFVGPNFALFYTFIQVSENITLVLDSPSETVFSDIVEIAIQECKQTLSTLVSPSLLSVQFSFNQHANMFITHYEVAVSTSSGSLDFTSVGNNTKVKIPITPRIGKKQYVHVRPCFTMSCLEHVTSNSFIADRQSPKAQLVKAVLHKDSNAGLADTDNYRLVASWDKFVLSHQKDYVKAYDHAIALDQEGGSMITTWTRLTARRDQNIFQVEEIATLPVHKYASLYFVIRCTNDAGVETIHGQPIELQDLAPLSGIQVYDLPLEYNLGQLNDYLYSQNLGNKTTMLHDADVDFSNTTKGIAGAVSGVYCDQYSWTLQSNVSIDCSETKDEDHCTAAKSSLTNTVKFTRVNLRSGLRYFICIRTGGSLCPIMHSCSNGFTVDTEPPLVGYVFLGSLDDGMPSRYISGSNLHVRWEEFMDKPMGENSGYIEGIMQYEVAIGSSPNSEDISPYQSVGMSNHTVITNLTFQPGRELHATVKCCDHAGFCVYGSSYFIADSTPPEEGKITVALGKNGLLGIPIGDIIVRLEGFEDPESGIVKRLVGMGTTPTSDDVLPLIQKDSDTIVIDAHDTLADGVMYYVQVKVVNRVGLWTSRASEPFYYDASPPETGYVRFGNNDEETQTYTNNTRSLSVSWGGFVDPHSGIVSNRVSIGTEPFLTNVISWRNTGIQTEYFTTLNLVPGERYYATVEACNGVLLCSQAASHALIGDDSPPVSGTVRVGYDDEHQCYQSNTHSLKISWNGFHDIQSGLQYADVCVSSPDSLCDVYAPTRIHHGNDVVLHDITLSSGLNYTASVITCNHAGMCTSGTSHVFGVDVTPPDVLTPTHLTTYSSLKPNTQFDRSYISVAWEMNDNESPMYYYSLSLTSHHDGNIPLDNVRLGDITAVTLPLSPSQQLKDGTFYTAKLVGCNMAHLCSVSESESFLIDSSPPLLGGFVEPMRWSNEPDGAVLDLAWEGFVDPHSSVIRYFLMISSRYNGYDLSDGIITVLHDDSFYTQHQSITLPNHQLEINSKVYLSIWAENGVVVTSDAAKVSVFVLQQANGTGVLDIEKHSCDTHYCNNDCTCAVVNQQCNTDGLPTSCVEQNSTDTGNHVAVYDGIYGNSMTHSPSSVCLPGYWISNYTSIPDTRYEWSVGMKGFDAGFGIFDISEDKIWFDVEMYDRAIYCLPPGEQVLLYGESYIYHTRVWHSFSNYTVYKSSGVQIDPTTPVVGLGKHVRDTESSFEEEIDFTTRLSGIYADWSGVFSDAESGINGYSVAVGMTSGGNELFGPEIVDLRTNISLPDVMLIPGTRYYTTVYASNALGMSVFDVSDGFVVDTEAPIQGSVYTSVDYKDQTHNSYVMRASWVGFADKHSYIKEYFYSIHVRNHSPVFKSAGFQNSVEESINGFGHGEEYVTSVKAVDGAGHYSDVAVSNPMVVDRTPPILLNCNQSTSIFKATLLCESMPVADNSNVEVTVCVTNDSVLVNKDDLYSVKILTHTDPGQKKARIEIGAHTDWVTFYHLKRNSYEFQTYFVPTGNDDVTPLLFTKLAEDSYIIEISRCTSGDAIVTSEPLIVRQVGYFGIHVLHPGHDPESGISNIEIGVGTNQGGFQLFTFQDVGPKSTSSFQLQLYHRMTIYVTCAATNQGGLRAVVSSHPIRIDWTSPNINNLTSCMIETRKNVYTVEASWIVVDEESEITGCFWNIGTIPNGNDILPYTPTSNLYSSSVENVTINSTDHVYVTVTCSNCLNFKSTKDTLSSLVPSSPPSSSDARVLMVPVQYTYYLPRDATQMLTSHMLFTYGGFDDKHFIDYYQYMLLSSGTSTEWISIGKMDYLVLWELGVESESTIEVFVRARYTSGGYSEAASAHLTVDNRFPQTTGEKLEWNLSETTLYMSWAAVFDRTLEPLLYQLYIGGQEVANYVIGLETSETHLSFTSSKLEPLTTVHCVITAISPAGVHTTYRETLYL